MFKENNSVEKNDSKKSLNDTNKKLLFVAAPILVAIFVVGLISTSNMLGLMGNSVSEEYTCEDSSFELKGNKCVKEVKEKAYVIGDVNKDGVIDVHDTVLLQKSTVDKVELDDYQKILGDVNKDGAVDVLDVVLMQKYMGADTNGTLGATHYINQAACAEGFKLKRGYCYGTITVDAIYIGNDNSANSGGDTAVSSESTSSESNATKQEALYIGDVNKDGAVDSLDVSVLEESSIDKVELDDYQKILGDVNKDGIVDAVDTAILKKYINSPQSGTITASSYIYQKACPTGTKLVGANCFTE